MRMAFAYAAAFFVGTAFLGLTALQRRRSKDITMANDTDANATSAPLESASSAPSKLHEQATAKASANLLLLIFGWFQRYRYCAAS